MEYLDWNNRIAAYYFNDSHKETEVFLYITRAEIERIGIDSNPNAHSDSNRVWDDYIESLKQNSKDDFISTLIDLKNQRIRNKSAFIYPPYIAYIAFLTAVLNNDHNDRSIYENINQELTKHQLPSLPHNNMNLNWNCVFADLEDWSEREMGGCKGVFRNEVRMNPGWTYLGILVTQMLLSRTQLRELSCCFFDYGLEPGQTLSDSEIKIFFKRYQSRFYLLRTQCSDLWVSIVRNQFRKWDGLDGKVITSDITAHQRRGTLRLAVHLNYLQGTIQIGLRLVLPENSYYPESVIDDTTKTTLLEEINGISQTVFVKSSIINNNKRIIDKNNNLVASFFKRDLYLLVPGITVKGWIQTEEVHPNDEVLILCKSNVATLLLDYGLLADTSRLKINGMEPDWHVYRTNLKNPDALAYYGIRKREQLDIYFINCISHYRKIYQLGKPKVTIRGLPAESPVSIIYSDGIVIHLNSMTILNSEGFDESVYRFPNPKNDIRYGIPFVVSPDISRKWEFVEMNNCTVVPRPPVELTSWGTISYSNEPKKAVQVPHYIRQSFKPERKMNARMNRQQPIYQPRMDALLNVISSRGQMAYKDIFEAAISCLEIYGKEPQNQLFLKPTLSQFKYSVLRHLEALGHIICDDEQQRVFVNPPELILIPSQYGNLSKAILTGARCEKLIKSIINKCYRRAKISIEPTYNTYYDGTLPRKIEIMAIGDQNNNFGIDIITEIASDTGVLFDNNNLVQFQLLSASASVRDYYDSLHVTTNDFKWKKEIFCLTSLKFVPYSHQIHQSMQEQLIRYTLNPYTFWFEFEFNGIKYIDKHSTTTGLAIDWARYTYCAKKLGYRNLILNYDMNILSVPATMPLPRTIHKSLVLLSGKIPEVFSNQKLKILKYDRVPIAIWQILQEKLCIL